VNQTSTSFREVLAQVELVARRQHCAAHRRHGHRQRDRRPNDSLIRGWIACTS
jgi:hypothetical protein